MSVRAIATHLLQFVLCVGRVTMINAFSEVECKVVVAYYVSWYGGMQQCIVTWLLGELSC